MIGAKYVDLVCDYVDEQRAGRFLERAKSFGVDPIGEKGEYHTLVVKAKRLGASIPFRCLDVKKYVDYYIASLA